MTGMARARLLYKDGGPYKFGSVEEQIAMYCVNTDRNLKLIEAYFSVVAPDKFNQLVRSYKSVLFPEDKYEDIKYLIKARKHFDKLKDLKLSIRPANMRAKKNSRA